MSDEQPDWGDDQFEAPKPLDKQEKAILAEFMQELNKAIDKFDEWLRTTQDKDPKRRIKFHVSINGEELRKLMFLRLVVSGGMGAMSEGDLAGEIVKRGVNALFDAYTRSRLMQAMKLAQIAQLPEALREAVMTSELRGSVKEIVDRVNRNSPLGDLLGSPAPEFDAPKAREGYQKPTVATQPTTAVKVGTCHVCNKPIAKGQVHEYDGKQFHADCLIDYGMGQKKGASI